MVRENNNEQYDIIIFQCFKEKRGAILIPSPTFKYKRSKEQLKLFKNDWINF